MEEIKLTTYTGDDPVGGSDPVSAKSKEEKEETVLQKKSQNTSREDHNEKDQKKAKELTVPSFALKKTAGTADDMQKVQFRQSQRKKKKKRSESEDRERPRRKKRRSASKQSGRSEDVPPNRSRKRKKKKKYKFSILKFIARLILLLLFAAAVSVVVIMNMFRLKEIRVTGNKSYSQEQIIQAVGIPSDAGNTLLTYMEYKDVDAVNRPLIKYVKIYMADRNTIGIEVSESAIVGQIKYKGSYYCFDDEGYIQEIVDSSKNSIPKVSGIDIDEAVQGTKLKTDDDNYFANITELAQIITERSIGVDEIVVTKDKAIMLYIDDQIAVAFGSPLLMEAKISEIVNILPELLVMEKSEDIEGILHLENYSTFQKSIVFTPGELPERDSSDDDIDKKKTRVKDDDEEMEDTEEELDEETEDMDEDDTEKNEEGDINLERYDDSYGENDDDFS